MRVIEKFTSINGEGLRQGELALFIRFANCNLRCSYCDTKYSFEHPVYIEESIEDLVNYAKKQNVKNITLTGGEPLIQEGINELIIALRKEGFRVEIETNGSVDIKNFYNDELVSYTLDYKLPTSLMESKMNLDNYKYISKKDSVKFVCGSKEDLCKAKSIILRYDLSPVFNMINLEDMVNFLIDNNLNDVRLCLQIHKIIWDPNKRGV